VDTHYTVVLALEVFEKMVHHASAIDVVENCTTVVVVILVVVYTAVLVVTHIGILGEEFVKVVHDIQLIVSAKGHDILVVVGLNHMIVVVVTLVTVYTPVLGEEVVHQILMVLKMIY
jgi:hypothetical protein